jgi:hypothetical protein
VSRRLREESAAQGVPAAAGTAPQNLAGLPGDGSGGSGSSAECAAKKADDGRSPRHPVEVGGRAGPEPTRYGDWEKGGRCIDF